MDETQRWKDRLERVKDLYAMYVEAICWRVEHPEGLPTTHPKSYEQPSLSRQQLSLLGIEDADKFVCTAWQHEFGGKGAASGASALPQWAVELLPHVIWFEDSGGRDVVLDTVEKPDGETFLNVEVVYFHWHEADIIKAIVTVLEGLFGAGQPLLCKRIRCSDDAWTQINAAFVFTDYFTASVRAWGMDVREGFLKKKSQLAGEQRGGHRTPPRHNEAKWEDGYAAVVWRGHEWRFSGQQCRIVQHLFERHISGHCRDARQKDICVLIDAHDSFRMQHYFKGKAGEAHDGTPMLGTDPTSDSLIIRNTKKPGVYSLNPNFPEDLPPWLSHRANW